MGIWCWLLCKSPPQHCESQSSSLIGAMLFSGALGWMRNVMHMRGEPSIGGNDVCGAGGIVVQVPLAPQTHTCP